MKSRIHSTLAFLAFAAALACGTQAFVTSTGYPGWVPLLWLLAAAGGLYAAYSHHVRWAECRDEERRAR